MTLTLTPAELREALPLAYVVRKSKPEEPEAPRGGVMKHAAAAGLGSRKR